MQIIDVSNPNQPMVVGQYLTSSPTGITGAGSYVYLSEGGRVRVLDISNPVAPVPIAIVDTPDWAQGVSLYGNFVYDADYYGGLQIIDVSDPNTPFLAGGVQLPGQAWGVSVAGNFAYVACRDGGLQVVDVSTPSAPFIIGSVDTPDLATEVTAVGDQVYIADYHGGLQVAAQQCAITTAVNGAPTIQSVRLARVWPNPARGDLRLEFELRNPGTVALSVYNVGGRLVRSLVEGQRVAGRHVVAWDGRNESGARVSGGVYLLRLEADGVSASAPVTLIR
jgi:hypothetical protein